MNLQSIAVLILLLVGRLAQADGCPRNIFYDRTTNQRVMMIGSLEDFDDLWRTRPTAHVELNRSFDFWRFVTNALNPAALGNRAYTSCFEKLDGFLLITDTLEITAPASIRTGGLGLRILARRLRITDDASLDVDTSPPTDPNALTAPTREYRGRLKPRVLVQFGEAERVVGSTIPVARLAEPLSRLVAEPMPRVEVIAAPGAKPVPAFVYRRLGSDAGELEFRHRRESVEILAHLVRVGNERFKSGDTTGAQFFYNFVLRSEADLAAKVPTFATESVTGDASLENLLTKHFTDAAQLSPERLRAVLDAYTNRGLINLGYDFASRAARTVPTDAAEALQTEFTRLAQHLEKLLTERERLKKQWESIRNEIRSNEITRTQLQAQVTLEDMNARQLDVSLLSSRNDEAMSINTLRENREKIRDANINEELLNQIVFVDQTPGENTRNAQRFVLGVNAMQSAASSFAGGPVSGIIGAALSGFNYLGQRSLFDSEMADRDRISALQRRNFEIEQQINKLRVRASRREALYALNQEQNRLGQVLLARQITNLRLAASSVQRSALAARLSATEQQDVDLLANRVLVSEYDDLIDLAKDLSRSFFLRYLDRIEYDCKTKAPAETRRQLIDDFLLDDLKDLFGVALRNSEIGIRERLTGLTSFDCDPGKRHYKYRQRIIIQLRADADKSLLGLEDHSRDIFLNRVPEVTGEETPGVISFEIGFARSPVPGDVLLPRPLERATVVGASVTAVYQDSRRAPNEGLPVSVTKDARSVFLTAQRDGSLKPELFTLAEKRRVVDLRAEPEAVMAARLSEDPENVVRYFNSVLQRNFVDESPAGRWTLAIDPNDGLSFLILNVGLHAY